MLSGYYNTQGKVSLLTKSKRDKAHVKIRDKMRKKAHGPSLLQSKFHNPLPKATNPSSCDDHAGSYKSLLNRNGYWRTQQERYDNMLHDGYSPSTSGNQDTVQSLVGRVIKRKRQLYPVSGNSLLTIRSYKRPTAPYAIQQQSVIKKMVGIEPLPQGKKKKGPYVLVLRTKRKDGNTKEPGGRKDSTVVIPPYEVLSEENNLQAMKAGSDKNHELQSLPKSNNTWKSNLQSLPELTNQPYLHDQAVTDFDLGLLKAGRLLQSPFNFTTHSMERPMLQKFPALPSISKSLNKISFETRSEDGNSEIMQKKAHDLQQDDQREIEKHVEMMTSRKPRASNSNEILEIMKAKKKAKREKHSDDDFKTLLKTKNRYTSATKMFKDDLLNMRQLSIISEGSSQTSENKCGKVSSAELANDKNSILLLGSVSSIRKTADSEIVRDEALHEHPSGKPPVKIYQIQEDDENL